MKTQNVKSNKRVTIKIPYFCTCCAKIPKTYIEKVQNTFFEKPIEQVIFMDFIKSRFELYKNVLQGPDQFFDVINKIFDEIQIEYSSREAETLNNCIKRMISFTAKKLNVDEKKSRKTTYMIIPNLETFNLFLEKFHDLLDNSVGIGYMTYGEGNELAYCPFTVQNNQLVVLTDVLFTKAKDYWDTTNIRK